MTNKAKEKMIERLAKIGADKFDSVRNIRMSEGEARIFTEAIIEELSDQIEWVEGGAEPQDGDEWRVGDWLYLICDGDNDCNYDVNTCYYADELKRLEDKRKELIVRNGKLAYNINGGE